MLRLLTTAVLSNLVSNGRMLQVSPLRHVQQTAGNPRVLRSPDDQEQADP